MNRRQFFARTLGVAATAAVGPDAIRQMVPTSPVGSFTLSEYTGTYAGIQRTTFKFWKTGDLNPHALDLERERVRMLRRLNADLFRDGRGEYVTLTGPDDTPDDPDY